jgi:transposase
VIDLLPDRTAETLATWLRGHPEVEVVSRDRAEAYAEGIRQGAPQAVQVADRFHLVKNVTESVERFLKRKQAALRHAAQTLTPPGVSPEASPPPIAASSEPPGRLTRHEQERQDCRTRRLARYEEVMTLHAQGQSLRAIAQATGLCRNTIRRYVRAEGFPEGQPRRRHSRVLAPFVAYLQERWVQGCQNARALYAELRQRGYRGGYTSLTDYLRAWRPAGGRAGRTMGGGARVAPVYSARQTLWLLLRPDNALTPEEQAYLTHLYHACPAVYLAQALAREFATLLREHDVNGLYRWLRSAESCHITELQAVARSMWMDKGAIEAAVTLEWSQGQVEGGVNRLKALKRAMFGRAHFDLLRQRVLHAA